MPTKIERKPTLYLATKRTIKSLMGRGSFWALSLPLFSPCFQIDEREKEEKTREERQVGTCNRICNIYQIYLSKNPKKGQ